MTDPTPARAPRRGPAMTATARQAVAVMASLAGLRALGWILLAQALADLVTALPMTLDPESTFRFQELLFTPPAPIGPVGPWADVAGALTLGGAGVAARALADWGQRVWGRRAALGAQVQVRRELVAHRLAGADGSRPRSGADAVLVTHGLQGLDDYYTQVLPALASAAVVPPVLGVWILTQDWVSALVLALTLPLVPFFMVLIGRHTQDRIAAAQAGLDRLSGNLLELARGLPVLVGLRRAGVQRRALERVSEDYRVATLGTLRTAFVSGLALELIASLSVAVVAVFIGVRLVTGQMDLHAGLVVLVLAAEVYLPMRDLGSAFHASEDGREAESRARAAVAEPVPPTALAALTAPAGAGEDAGHDGAVPDHGAVRLRSVQVAYGTRRVVRGLDLTLAPGTLTVFGSASGTGKSTVLHLLAGLLRTGPATVSGTVTGVDPARTVWVGQHPRLTEPTVAAELDLAAGRPLAEATRQAVLAAASLTGFADRVPHELSPGEQRRVALARALARLEAAHRDEAGGQGSPTRGRGWLLLLDEPTAHLDEASAAGVRATLTALTRGGSSDDGARADGAGVDGVGMDIPGSGITGPAGLSLPPLTVLAASHDPALHRAADQLVDENGRGLAPAAADRPIDVRLGAGPRPSATAAESDVTAADAGPDTATDVALATDADAEPAAPYPGLRAALRVLPWGERRLWFGVAWATATHLSAALLAALSGWLIVTASGQPPILYLLAVIVLVRAFGLSRAVCRYADRLATHDAVLRWADRLRLDLWDALARRPALWGRLSRADGALSVLIADVDALRDAAPRVIVPAPAAVAAWLFTAGAVVVLAPELAVATLVPGLLGLVLIPALSALLDRRDTHRTLRHRAALLDRVGVVLGAAADLHGLGRSEAAVARLADADAALQRPQRRTAWVAGLGRGLAVVFSGAAALAAAGTATQTGTSAPLAAFVVFLALSWAEPFGALAQSAQQTGALVSQARAAAALLGPQPVGTTPSSTRPAPRAVDPAHPATGPAPVRVDGLRLRGAGFSHAGAPAPLWEHLDLDVRRGATAVVTGPSGAGKSTLLAVLLGFLPLDEGRYTLLHRTSSGLTATPADEAGLARVAWTPQDALVFDSTVRGNLALARDRADAPDDAELTAVLELVGLGPWLADAPQGLDTPVGPGGHTLSGGQRQRLAVARALVARADVVLLDEPTAHVGQDEALTLMADLRRALAGHTTVVVTHDTRLAAGADVHLALG